MLVSYWPSFQPLSGRAGVRWVCVWTKRKNSSTWLTATLVSSKLIWKQVCVVVSFQPLEIGRKSNHLSYFFSKTWTCVSVWWQLQGDFFRWPWYPPQRWPGYFGGQHEVSVPQTDGWSAGMHKQWPVRHWPSLFNRNYRNLIAYIEMLIEST